MMPASTVDLGAVAVALKDIDRGSAPSPSGVRRPGSSGPSSSSLGVGACVGRLFRLRPRQRRRFFGAPTQKECW